MHFWAPVVHSVVSLMSLLVDRMLTVLVSTISISQVYLYEMSSPISKKSKTNISK